MKLFSVIGKRDKDILPQWLRHYQWQVDKIRVIANDYTIAEMLPLGMLANVRLEPFTALDKVKWLKELIDKEVENEEYVVIADADEFFTIPRLEGYFEVARGIMIDKVAYSVNPFAIDFEKPYNGEMALKDVYNLDIRFTDDVMRGETIKHPIFMHTGEEVFSNHFVKYREDISIYPNELKIEHYKWRENTVNYLRERIDKYKLLNYHWYNESVIAIGFIEEYNKDRIGNFRMIEPLLYCQ